MSEFNILIQRSLRVLLVIAGCVWAGAALAQDAGLPGPSPSVTTRPAPDTSTDSAAIISPPAAGISIDDAPGLTDENYRLGSGDKLRVTVYGEDDLSGEFLVDASGQVQLPLVGQVKAAGLTLHDFIDEFSSQLKDGYLKDPKISVEVINYRPFYIMGEVNKPGEYPYENGLNVMGAVALAGGYTYRADDREVYVRHSGSTTEQAVSASAATQVQPGDIIRVDERIF